MLEGEGEACSTCLGVDATQELTESFHHIVERCTDCTRTTWAVHGRIIPWSCGVAARPQAPHRKVSLDSNMLVPSCAETLALDHTAAKDLADGVASGHDSSTKKKSVAAAVAV